MTVTKRMRAIVAQGIESVIVRWVARILASVGFCITLVFLLFWDIKNTGFALFFGALLLSPYLILVYLNESKSSTCRRPRTYVLLVAGVLFIGIGAMVDITFLHPDPLGLLVMPFMAVPIQFVLLGVILGVCK